MIDLSPIVRFALLLVRPGALLIGSPMFGGPWAPAHVRIGLTVLLAAAVVPTAAVPAVNSLAFLTVMVLRELAIGVSLGIAARAVVAAAELAGTMSGFQMGLSLGAIIDPISGVRNNVIASLYSNITLMVFFLTNAHHAFLRVLGASYAALPPGSGGVDESLPAAIMRLLGVIFSLGTRLAAPVVVVLVVTEIAISLIARSARALNLMALSLPLRVLVGLIVLGVTAPAVAHVVASMTDGALQLGVQTARAFR